MIFREMGLSIFRPAAYAAFARQKAGRALLYVVLIAVPLAVLGGIRVGMVLGLGEGAAQALVTGPDFRVRAGILEFDAPQPYVFGVGGGEVGVVDTTGATDESYLSGRANGVLVLRDRAIIKTGLQQQVIYYADLGPGAEPYLSRAGLVRMFSAVARWAWFFGLLWLLASVGAKIVAALALSLVAWTLIELRGRGGGYRAALGVASHALTLSLLLAFARTAAVANIVAFGLLYWGAALVYTVAGTSALPDRPAER